jgi:hypothetical protein
MQSSGSYIGRVSRALLAFSFLVGKHGLDMAKAQEPDDDSIEAGLKASIGPPDRKATAQSGHGSDPAQNHIWEDPHAEAIRTCGPAGEAAKGLMGSI